MNDELFEELVASVREGGAILRGEARPARTTVVTGPDVRSIRARYDLSQAGFAALLGISLGTLRNWEQGRRTPEGPARVLLQVAAAHPDAVWDVVRPGKRGRAQRQGRPGLAQAAGVGSATSRGEATAPAAECTAPIAGHVPSD